MSKLDMEIAYRIRNLREEKGYSRERFEELSGVTARFLSDIESGRKDITTHTLRKICSALETSPDYILFGNNAERDQILCLVSQMDRHQQALSLEILKAILRDKRG